MDRSSRLGAQITNANRFKKFIIDFDFIEQLQRSKEFWILKSNKELMQPFISCLTIVKNPYYPNFINEFGKFLFESKNEILECGIESIQFEGMFGFVKISWRSDNDKDNTNLIHSRIKKIFSKYFQESKNSLYHIDIDSFVERLVIYDSFTFSFIGFNFKNLILSGSNLKDTIHIYSKRFSSFSGKIFFLWPLDTFDSKKNFIKFITEKLDQQSLNARYVRFGIYLNEKTFPLNTFMFFQESNSASTSIRNENEKEMKRIHNEGSVGVDILESIDLLYDIKPIEFLRFLIEYVMYHCH